MTASDAVAVIDLVERADIAVWLDGGWAVDAALEVQTRPHDDLDLVVDLGLVDRLVAILGRRDYALAGGGAPKSFELVDRQGRQVDVHPVAFTEAGDGRYLMENDEEWIYPAEGFSGRGRILGRRVHCLTPEVQVLCHKGYEPHRSSYDDVRVLCSRFGITMPEEYRLPRASYARR